MKHMTQRIGLILAAVLVFLSSYAYIPVLAADTPGVSAAPVEYTLSVDGKNVSLWAYGIDSSIYFKLRDLAMVLNGTKKQFGVEWDGERDLISIYSDTSYTPVGGELSAPAGLKTAYASISPTFFQGYSLSSYIIDDAHYIKLSDLAASLRFSAVCDDTAHTIQINTVSNAIILPKSMGKYPSIDNISLMSARYTRTISSDGRLVISYDGGRTTVATPVTLTQEEVKEHASDMTYPAVYMSEEKTAIAYGGYCGDPLYVTTSGDMGKTWSAPVMIQNSVGVSSLYMGFLTPDDGYLVIGSFHGMGSEDNFVYLTVDGGKTWTQTGNPNKLYARMLTGAGFADNGTGFLCFRYEFDDFEPAICWTQDGGLTWEKLYVKLPEQFEKYYSKTPLSPVFDRANGVFPIVLGDYDGTSKTIYLTSDDYGKTWRYDEKFNLAHTWAANQPLPEQLLQKLQAATGEKLINVQYDDFDGDGKSEAFVMTGKGKLNEGGNLWFVSADEISKLNDMYLYSSPEMIQIGDKKFIKYEQEYATGKPLFLWSVENGKSKPVISGEAQNLTQMPDGTYTVLQNTLDMMSDGTGRTVKPYWLHYSNGFHEYGAIEITQAQLLKFTGADNILKQIKAEGGTVKNILYRENHIININYQTDQGMNRYVSLKYDDTSVSVLQESDGSGIYLKALLPDIATYPAGTPPTQPGTSNNRPNLTWQAVKKLVEGSLNYTDIRDSFYYKEIGSGLYIVSFPIQDAPEFSLTASSTGPSAAPMWVGLRCEPAGLSLKLNAENLGIMMALYNDSGSQQEINKLFYKEIPVPQDAKTYGNIMYMTGMAPDEIIQDYGNMLLHNGWELTDALGMKRFYKKSINGDELVVSVLCPQEGGLQDKDIVTVIRFKLEPLPVKKDELEQERQDIRTLVEAFGKRLQRVSLSAPKDTVAASIKENYSDYVTSELLQKWLADPQSAPGRALSGPWPDRIDILRLETGDKNQYTVQGEIFEVTGVELAGGGAAAKRPVTIVVQKVNGRWLISSVTTGEYAQRGPVAYENTRYGFSFYLPETWKGYSIVEEQWEGTDNGELVETGPQLLIRHPDWTEKNPRQDIPIMVFTLEQWNALQKGGFFVSAAPVGPSKLGCNSAYVFALPARYNYALQTGFEEVEEILSGAPLWPVYPSEKRP